MRVVSRPHLRQPVLALRDALQTLAVEGGSVRIEELVRDLTRTLSPELRSYLESWGELSVQPRVDSGEAEFEARGPARKDSVVGVTVEVPPSLHGWISADNGTVVVRSDPGASPRVGVLGLRIRLSRMRLSSEGIEAVFGGGAFRVAVGV